MSDKSIMSARQAAELDHSFGRHGWSPEDVKWLSAGETLGEVLAVRRRTHEIVRREQVINTDLLPPTDTVIRFPRIRKQLTEGAFATKDEDSSSSFGYRNLTVALPEREKPTGAARLRAHQFGENMKFSRMVEAAGGLVAVKERHLTTQWQIRWAVEETMRRRKEAKAGPLRMDGWAEFFLVEAPETEEGVAVVAVHWGRDRGYWRVWSPPLSHGFVWPRGYRLFLCANA